MVRRVFSHKGEENHENFDEDLESYTEESLKTEEESVDKGLFNKLTPVERAWLAGLFQAEAHFSKDSRVRSLNPSEDYTPPPPAPYVKLDMVEEDLMRHVANLLGQNLKVLNRPTKANKVVYRVNMYSRQKVESFLNAILPYVYGDLKRGVILDLLKDCEDYRKWVADGGRSKAGRHGGINSKGIYS